MKFALAMGTGTLGTNLEEEICIVNENGCHRNVVTVTVLVDTRETVLIVFHQDLLFGSRSLQ